MSKTAKKTAEQRIRESKDRHPDWTDGRRASALGVTVAMVRDVLASKTVTQRSGVGRSLADFRANFDKSYIVPAKVRKALASMDGDWMYEVEFAKFAGVPLNDIGNFRDEFADDHVLVVRDRKVWARSSNVKRKMQEML